MKQRLILVKINSDYCDFLRTFDKRVPYNYNKKSNRPFVGVLFRVDLITILHLYLAQNENI